eukprot:TRINITY_DN4611_c0_g4_i1.p1 TRINITY_DN4611_c0_g4~~TRINITY_DN4611_c0_g4_i1.p1  ORF type:complete len:1105 (+),score=243.03 TRINITY_DN4611_c0_g4_i1:343-3657(+)
MELPRARSSTSKSTWTAFDVWADDSSDESDEEAQKEFIVGRQRHSKNSEERKERPELAKVAEVNSQPPTSRKSTLTEREQVVQAIQRTSVLQGLSTPCHVYLTRHLKIWSPWSEDKNNEGSGVLFKAGTNCEDSKMFVVLGTGVVEFVSIAQNGEEVILGYAGPGSVLGGAFALGLASCHLLTIRKTDAPAHADAPLTMYSMTSEAVTGLHQFHEDLPTLRENILQDMKFKMIPFLQRVMTDGFFQRYTPKFVRKLIKTMSVRVFAAGQLIFEEGDPGTFMGYILAGKMKVFVKGVKRTEKGAGDIFGEAALLDTLGSRRTATVRCCESTDAIMCIISKEHLFQALARYRANQPRFDDHVRTHLTALFLKDHFAEQGLFCDGSFLQFVADSCERLVMKADDAAYEVQADEKSLLLVQAGVMRATSGPPLQQTATFLKGDSLGLQSALGFEADAHTLPAYQISAEAGVCIVLRISQEVLTRALTCFPDYIKPFLELAGKEVPPTHPLVDKSLDPPADCVTRRQLTALLSRCLLTSDIDVNFFTTAVQSLLRIVVYDTGSIIAEEGLPCQRTTLLLCGSVEVKKKDGKMSQTETQGPAILDGRAFLGVTCSHSATVTAMSTCLAYHLDSDAHRSVLRRVGPNAVAREAELQCLDKYSELLDAAADAHRRCRQQLQSRLRQLKVFQKASSEFLGIASVNAEVQTYLPGEVIVTSGDAVEAMYVILLGTAEAATQENKEVSELKEGASINELLCYGQTECRVTVAAAAASDSVCVCAVLHKTLLTYAAFQCKTDMCGRQKGQSTKTATTVAGKPRRKLALKHANTVAVTTEDAKAFRSEGANVFLSESSSPRQFRKSDTGLVTVSRISTISIGDEAGSEAAASLEVSAACDDGFSNLLTPDASRVGSMLSVARSYRSICELDSSVRETSKRVGQVPASIADTADKPEVQTLSPGSRRHDGVGRLLQRPVISPRLFATPEPCLPDIASAESAIASPERRPSPRRRPPPQRPSSVAGPDGLKAPSARPQRLSSLALGLPQSTAGQDEDKHIASSRSPPAAHATIEQLSTVLFPDIESQSKGPSSARIFDRQQRKPSQYAKAVNRSKALYK